MKLWANFVKFPISKRAENEQKTFIKLSKDSTGMDKGKGKTFSWLFGYLEIDQISLLVWRHHAASLVSVF